MMRIYIYVRKESYTECHKRMYGFLIQNRFNIGTCVKLLEKVFPCLWLIGFMSYRFYTCDTKYTYNSHKNTWHKKSRHSLATILHIPYYTLSFIVSVGFGYVGHNASRKKDSGRISPP